MSEKKNPNILYDEISDKSGESFWGFIPRSFSDAVSHTINNFKTLDNSDRLSRVSRLKEILIDYHEDLGILTTKVRENIDKIERGSVLVGQQPVIFGGPGFIGNKLACLISLDEMFSKRDFDLAPVFFVGDYDGLQKELTRQYFPNPISHSAHIIDSGDYLPEESSIAAHAANLPPLTWVLDELKKLDDNFRGFKKQVKGVEKKVVEERWNHIKTLLVSSFNSTTTLSEWGTKIWGMITNIINDFGVVYLPTSHPEIRELVADRYFPFIENRETYTRVFKETMDKLEDMGYQTTLPHRHEDYAPFTFECGDDYNRITTTLNIKEDKIFAEGTCPECKHSFSINVSTIDHVKAIATRIGPRVDTSQAVFQDLMNIRLRISGPGEIAYYAIAVPALKSIGFDIPLFVKYKRVFYNTVWNEKLGKLLYSRKQGSIHQNRLFELLRDRVLAIRSGDTVEIHKSESEMQHFIMKQYELLLSGKQSIDTQKYLGWQYGKFTRHKFGQEVSWVWFDLAIQTGLSDYIQSYMRVYNTDSRVGVMYFINSLV